MKIYNIKIKNYFFYQLICLITISFPFLIFGQVNQFDNYNKKHGIWFKNYPKSNVKRYIGKFIHGVPVDTFVYKSSNGAISSIIIFSENGKKAKSKVYYENRILMAKGNYINKQKDSTWMYFTKKGKLSYTEEFKNGKLDGLKIIYFNQNNKKSSPSQIITYKNGILNGVVKEYFSNGKIKLEGFYINDLYEGLLKKYHPNGKLAVVNRYKNGVKDGWTILYDEEGSQIKKVYYQNGKTLNKKFTKN